MRGLLLAALLLCAPVGASAQIIPNPPAGNGSMTFQAGRYYKANGITGVTASSTFVTGSLIAGIPIYIPNAVTLQTLSCDISGTVSGTAHARMALYTDAGGYPGTPVAGADSGDLTQTSAGVMTSGTLGVALAPGWYWPVWESSGLAGGTIYAATAQIPSMSTQLGSSSIPDMITKANRALLETHAYGSALPSPWTTTTENSTSSFMPVIVLGF